MAILYPTVPVLSLAATLVVYVLELAGIYALPWLMFLTATVASVRGMGVGLAAAMGSMVVLYFFRSSSQDYLVMGLILLLSAYLADQVGASLRRAHRRAKQLAQVQDVFLQGLEVIPRFFNRQQLLQELPTLLSKLLQNSHLHIWKAVGSGQLRLLEGPDTHSPGPLVSKAAQERQAVWSEHPTDSLSVFRGRGPYEVAVPINMRDELVAVLHFVRGEPWRKEELELFSRLGQTIGYQLAHLRDLELRRLLLALADGLAIASDKRMVAEVVLQHLLPALEVEAGVVMQNYRGALHGIAWRIPEDLQSTLTPLALQLGYGQGMMAWRAYHSGIPQFSDSYSSLPEALPELKELGFEALVAYPVHTRDAMKGRVIMVLGSRAKVAWTSSKREILLGVERLLNSALERVLQQEVHQRISRLLTEAWSYPSNEAYQHILEAAVELVPGSECGSLWVLDEGEYICRAATGTIWNFEERWSNTDFLEWYGPGLAEASQPTPRIRLMGNRANLCLPINHQGQILAYLNLDSLQDPEAFAEDSLATAQLFDTPIATLVHEMRNRLMMEKAALMDELTGLYNRRAFNQRLDEELKRARRYQYPLSLLVIDLKNFKYFNDWFGHAAGDRALIAVAQVLQRTQRAGDLAFRWGGDEFAILLPQTNSEGARTVSERLHEAISNLCLVDIPIHANLGWATFPQEANDAENLLHLADQRMYQEKKGSAHSSEQ